MSDGHYRLQAFKFIIINNGIGLGNYKVKEEKAFILYLFIGIIF